MTMLGAQCSVCCSQCGCKPEERLPYTMTVEFSGLKNKTHGNYCDLVITSEVGGGAAGVATSPGGCDGDHDPLCCTNDTGSSGECYSTQTCDANNRGPLTGVLLTDSGCGYFVFRTEPTLTVEGGSGTKADFAVTLKKDKCAWSVDTVTVTGGEGYAEGDALSFAAANGDTVVTPATAILRTDHAEPTLTASVAGGTGASITIAYTKNAETPETWSIASLTVGSGGSSYTNGSPVSFTLGSGDVAVEEAIATVATNRVQPTLSASVSGTGSGASLTVSLAPNYDSSAWTVSGIGITDGGTGYSEWDYVSVSVTDGQAAGWGWFDAYVTAVDVDGAITAITVYSSDEYYKDGGVIQSVTLSAGGKFFKETGVPYSVEVTEPGKYFREDPDAEPCADVTVKACGGGYYGGSDAKITPTFGTDKNDPTTYGRIVSLKIDDGGSDYLAWGWKKTCYEQLNGIPFVLKAATPLPLVSLCFDSCFGSGAAATVVPFGARSEPDICLVGSGTGGTITPTLAKADDENDNKWLPTWKISSVSASGGHGYTNDETATIDYRGATVKSAAQVTLQATAVSDPPDPTNDGALTGATVVEPGAFYVQHDYDGTPTPIKLVTLDSGGSGYARYGREQPTLQIKAASGSSGSGGSFTPTLAQQKDSCGLDYWRIESVFVSGGSCYGVNGRTAPTLTATTSVGSGASIAIKTDTGTDKCGGTYWKISQITAKGGTGYEDGTPVTIKCSGNAVTRVEAKATLQATTEGVATGVTVSEPGAYFVKGPDESLSISLATANDKEAAKVVLSVQTDNDGVPTGVTVLDSGTGGSAVIVANLSGDSVASLTLQAGGGGYGPAPVVVFSGGGGSGAAATAVADPSGTIKSVSLSSGGSGYTSPPTVNVVNHGAYYRENKSLAPYVADVTVSVHQLPPSTGSGAVITATVGSDTSKTEEFGKITKLTIEDGGADYQILGGPTDCRYDGLCGMAVQFRGKGKPIEVTLDDAVFHTENFTDCTNIPTSASVYHSIGEGSVTLTAGGAWNGDVSVPCCGCTPLDSTACETGTGIENVPCGAPYVPCPPCTGECDGCNKCGNGCGCNGGKCVPCCGPCDAGNPCPQGCQCVDGKCQSCSGGEVFAYGGCLSDNCEADFRAAIEQAGYTDIRIIFAGGQSDCGQKWLSSISATCCGTVGGGCGFLETTFRCLGPCGASPPNCPDTSFAIPGSIPICCQNPLP